MTNPTFRIGELVMVHRHITDEWANGEFLAHIIDMYGDVILVEDRDSDTYETVAEQLEKLGI